MTNNIGTPGNSEEYSRLLERLRHLFDKASNLKRQHINENIYNVNSAISNEFGLDTDDDAELISIIIQVRKEQTSMIKTVLSEYEKIAVETFGIWDKIFSTFIPELCEALYREQPNLNEEEIKSQIIGELINFYPGIINDRHLRAWTIQN